MSDDEEGTKKTGYRLEYASSARAKCKGPKPCSGTAISKGELRFGTLIDFRGNTSFVWRHWGCVTPKIISNIKTGFDSADDLDGFEDLSDEDKVKIRKAWQDGHVADEDIPDSARKPEVDDDEEGESAKPKKKSGGKGAAKKAEDEDKKGVFKLEYASAGRSKCKDGCGENIGKDYFRLGYEIESRGTKSFTFTHWGCTPDKMITKVKKSYDEPSDIEGFSELKEAEQEKVKAAWEAGTIPDDDKGPGEPVETEKKKAPARRTKSGPPKKRARKAQKSDDEVEEDEEEKPQSKEKAPAKKPAAKEKAPAKKRAPKKKQEDDESGEDLGDEIAAVTADEDEEDGEEAAEQEESSKKRKRAPASKTAKATTSKPSSKAVSSKPASKAAATKPASKAATSTKPASKASSKPTSKRSTKPASSRGKKPQEETIHESEEGEEED